MPIRIIINSLDIREAMGGVNVYNEDTNIRITPNLNEEGFEIFCDVRQLDGAWITGQKVFRLINGTIIEE